MSFNLELSFLLGFLLSLPFFIIVYRRVIKDRDARNSTLTALRKLDEIMMASLGLDDVAQKVTDAIAFELKFEIGVLALLDERTGLLKRVAMSRTPVGLKTHQYLPIPYTRISIPLSNDENLMIQVLKEGKRKITHNLYDVFRPVIDEQTSKKIQATIGIKTSLVYPVSAKGERIGVMIISLGKEEKEISNYELEMIEKLIDAMGIALDNAKVYQQLKGALKLLGDANLKLKELDELKNDFVSVTSHELRTPMTAIRSYAWMALHRSDMPLSKTMEKYIVRILISAERMINLVSDMLNISRIESGRIEINPEPVDLILLCRDILDEVYYSKATEKNIQFQLLEQPIPKVFADPEKLRQVLLNIMGNALKFSPLGGKITIGFFTDGKTVETYLKDQGPGISQGDMGKLFKKFGRLDASYTAAATSGGTGLGLYISRSLIDLMHGRIWAISEGLGKGATFTIALPVASQEVIKEADRYRVKAHGEAKGLEPVAL